MKRISLFMAGALACLAVASVGAGAASAETVIPQIRRSCHDETSNVRGGGANITVIGTDVSSSQAFYANCGRVDGLFTDVTAQELQTPQDLDGYHVVPFVESTHPLVVQYRCVFQSADTASRIVAKFKVTYR